MTVTRGMDAGKPGADEVRLVPTPRPTTTCTWVITGTIGSVPQSRSCVPLSPRPATTPKPSSMLLNGRTASNGNFNAPKAHPASLKPSGACSMCSSRKGTIMTPDEAITVQPEVHPDGYARVIVRYPDGCETAYPVGHKVTLKRIVQEHNDLHAKLTPGREPMNSIQRTTLVVAAVVAVIFAMVTFAYLHGRAEGPLVGASHAYASAHRHPCPPRNKHCKPVPRPVPTCTWVQTATIGSKPVCV
jgi:hypothetical protein